MAEEGLVPLKNVVGMDYEPRNEAGVIILFTLVMKQLGFSGVIKTQGNFPDCTARRKGKNVILEFEYKSRTFEAHGHLRELGKKKCTVICWEDNWQTPPTNIRWVGVGPRELSDMAWKIAIYAA